LNSSWNLDTAVEITSTNVFVNTTLYDNINQSANVTVNTVPYADPVIYKDGSVCGDCSIIGLGHETGTLRFSVTSFSNYTWAEANQSKIMNNGTTNVSMNVYIAVEWWNATDSSWMLDDVVVNETVVVNTSTQIKLDTLFNGLWKPDNNASYGAGEYRVYAAALDSNMNVWQAVNESYVNATYNFTIDDRPVMSTVRIDPASPESDEALNGYCNATDAEGDTVTYFFKWYKDSVLNNSGSYGPTAQGSEAVASTLGSGSTTAGENWTFECLAQDSDQNATTWINSSVVVANAKPDAQNVILVSDQADNATTGNLTGSFDYYDADSDAQTDNMTRWYNNTVVVSVLENETTIGSGNTTVGENWTFSVRVHDGNVWGDWVNSSVLTIVNSVPTTPTQNSPTNGGFFNVNDILLNCSGSTDADGESITYYYYGDTTDGTTLLGANDTHESYNWTGLNNTLYYWKCAAGDGTENSSATGAWNFTNAPNISIQVKTISDVYDSADWVNLTDPPGGEDNYQFDTLTSLAKKDSSGVFIGDEIIEERTRSFKKFRLADADGKKRYRVGGQIGPVHYKLDAYDDNELYKEIDLTTYVTPEEEWYAAMETNGYQVRFWQELDDAKYVAEFRRMGKWVRLVPLALVWENDLGEQEIISEVKETGYPIIDNDGYHVTWKDVFGEGIDFRYNLNPDKFFKTVVLNDENVLPKATIADDGLRLRLVVGFSWSDNTIIGNEFSKGVSVNGLPSEYVDSGS